MSSVWERADAADQSRPGEIYFHVGTGPRQLCRRMAVYTQQAKGLKKWTVVIKHALRNALIPIITIAGTDLGNIFTGSVLVESVFSIPGIGKMLVDSINTRDLPIVQGGVMYIAVICVIMYLVIDILYTVADPRIRLGKESEN